MELRKEIEPRFDIAEKHYRTILQLILDYTDYCDENGDEDNAEYERLEARLHRMTGKDMSQYDLWEWWEGDGAQNLAFDIALPDPQVVADITRDELYEIVRRLKTFEVSDEDGEEDGDECDDGCEGDILGDISGDSFMALFGMRPVFGNGYYDCFLEKNFKTYDNRLFQSHKDKDGNYFENSIDQIVEKLWNDGNH